MSPSAVRLVEIGPDDAAFARWCDVWAASEALDRPGEPPRAAGEHVVLGRELLGPGGSRDGTHRAALLGEDVVGALRLLFPVRDNTTVAFVDVAVLPEHRRRSIGGALLAEALRLAAAAGRGELISEVDEPGPGTAGRAFALRHGWTCALLETRRDLVLPPVEEERWDDQRIREIERLDLARGRTVLSAGAVRDGRLVAFTDLHVPLSSPEHARQGATLVLREHRGHWLGGLIKAAVLRDLATAFLGTTRISTYNSEGNAPMVAVNEALGFRPAGHLSTWTLRLTAGSAPG